LALTLATIDRDALTRIGHETIARMGQLDDAVRAFHEAEDAVRTVERDRIAAKAAVEKARTKLAEAIVEAVRGGMRQVDVAAVTGYSRERVRQICRAAGVEPVS